LLVFGESVLYLDLLAIHFVGYCFSPYRNLIMDPPLSYYFYVASEVFNVSNITYILFERTNQKLLPFIFHGKLSSSFYLMAVVFFAHVCSSYCPWIICNCSKLQLPFMIILGLSLSCFPCNHGESRLDNFIYLILKKEICGLMWLLTVPMRLRVVVPVSSELNWIKS
jgi:hypothetical protein